MTIAVDIKTGAVVGQIVSADARRTLGRGTGGVMTREEIIGKWITIQRPDPDGNTQRIFGLVEWASEDLRNFRLTGIGHIGLPLHVGSFEYFTPTND